MKPYAEASSYLLSHLETVCDYLFPEGKREGTNFIVGNIAGQPGRSFSIALEPPAKRGLYKDFANGDKGSRNLPHLWKIVRGIPYDNHFRFFEDLGRFAGQSFGYNGAGSTKDFDWPRRLREFSAADAQRLATHPKRQWQVATLLWLHAHKYGLYAGHVTFAMRDATGQVVGVNRWIESQGKWKFIKSPTLLVIGDPASATELHIHESINDLIAMLDRTGWHLDPTKLFFCTWGTSGAKLVKARIPTQIDKVYVWEQHDQPDPKTGIPPNEGWQAGIARAAARPVHLVHIPEAYEDVNQWTIAGAMPEQIAFARDFATLYQQPSKQPEPPKPDYKDLPQNFPPAEERPAHRVYDTPIKINDREFKAGVYFHEVESFGDKKFPKDTWICASMLILARTATTRDRDFGRLLEYHSSNGVLRRWSMPMELLAGDGAEVLGRLLRDGLDINIPHKKKVLDYIAAATPTEFFRCETRTGWHCPTIFILPEEIIAAENEGKKVWFQAASRTADYTRSGTLKDWKTGVAAKGAGNNYLLFGISFGLAGPLMERLGLRGIGCHIFGDSSSGKTSITEAAASCWGHGHNYMQTWNLTANGIETVCVEHTDTLLALDEIKEIDARDLDRVVYSGLNGQGKIRSDRSGQARTPSSWRVALFSTGEYSIRARLGEAGIAIKTGQELRLIDLPVTGEKFGIFSNLHDAHDGAEFANQLRGASSDNYGHAGPAMVKAILERDTATLRNLHQQIIAYFPTTNAQEARVAEMFGAVALAGEIAAHAEIVPWTAATSQGFSDSDSVNAAVALFNRWKENRDTTNSFSSEHGNILHTVGDFIDKHSDSRFSNIDPVPNFSPKGVLIEPPIIRDRAGYWEDDTKQTPTVRTYLFTNSGLREATKGYDFRRVLKALDDAGAFTAVGSINEKAKNRRGPDQRQLKLYHIDPNKLQ